MARSKGPVTPAVRALRSAGVQFTPRPYDYEEHGGTRRSAEQLGIDEHAVIKTIVLEDERGHAAIVLMHGDCRVATKKLARIVGAKTMRPCDPATVTKLTGYRVGGTSPFGTRKTVPVYMQATLRELPRVVINGGKRGFLVAMAPEDIIRVLEPELVDVAET